MLADEFRDGNVPAAQQLLPVAQRAFQALPETVTEFYFRGDPACDEEGLLSWQWDEKRADGPRAKIGLAVSADRPRPGTDRSPQTGSIPVVPNSVEYLMT